MISTRKYRLEKFFHDGRIEKAKTVKVASMEEALKKLNALIAPLHNVDGETYRLTCLGSGEFMEWKFTGGGVSKLTTDTFLKSLALNAAGK